ncbi:MAG: succinate dehydrogenase assembly factor 2 [Pseudomonadota bacterium]|nr:succinate dehydrogenase assembly factor 2 [Pseudomonadota bacterium]MEC9458787.1 succinate dehydrogenase assembly factor 2 [Pseudomonadota bacterium]
MKIYLKKLFFKASHRGTKEMDILLGNFANKQLESMTDNDLALFDELLDISDPELYKWLTSANEEIIPEKFRYLINKIANK